jgi:hypothetical protein
MYIAEDTMLENGRTYSAKPTTTTLVLHLKKSSTNGGRSKDEFSTDLIGKKPNNASLKYNIV